MHKKDILNKLNIHNNSILCLNINYNNTLYATGNNLGQIKINSLLTNSVLNN